MQQTWTVFQHDGPNHRGLLNQGAAFRRRHDTRPLVHPKGDRHAAHPAAGAFRNTAPSARPLTQRGRATAAQGRAQGRCTGPRTAARIAHDPQLRSVDGLTGWPDWLRSCRATPPRGSAAR